MYGWRARIGVIIPSLNTTCEVEYPKLAPEGVSFHFSRMMSTGLSVKELTNMADEAEKKCFELLSAGVDMIVFACTSGSFIKGREGDRQFTENLEKITGIPVISTSQAIISAINAININSISISTPYNKEINERAKSYFESFGIRVIKILGLGCVNPKPLFPLTNRPISHIGIQNPLVAYKLARITDDKEAKACLISCTNFRTIEIIQMLEVDLKKPVITSNQATI